MAHYTLRKHSNWTRLWHVIHEYVLSEFPNFGFLRQSRGYVVRETHSEISEKCDQFYQNESVLSPCASNSAIMLDLKGQNQENRCPLTYLCLWNIGFCPVVSPIDSKCALPWWEKSKWMTSIPTVLGGCTVSWSPCFGALPACPCPPSMMKASINTRVIQ